MLADDPFAPMTLQTFLAGKTTYPVMDQLSSIQKAALSRMYSPAVLSRIANNEFKSTSQEKPLTLECLFTTTAAAIWSELDSHKNIGPLHRQLQRAHLETLLGMYLTPSASVPDDAKLLAWDQIKKIQSRIKAMNKTGLDTYSKLHLDQASQMITRALEAKQTVSVGGASRSTSLLDTLTGETPAH